MPFIKKSLFDLKNTDAATIEGYEKLLGNYPKSLIDIPRKVNKKVPFQVKKIYIRHSCKLSVCHKEIFCNINKQIISLC